MNQPEPERDKSAETVVSVDSYMIGEKLAEWYTQGQF